MTTDERKGWVAVDYESRKKGRKEGIKAGASAERERIARMIKKEHIRLEERRIEEGLTHQEECSLNGSIMTCKKLRAEIEK